MQTLESLLKKGTTILKDNGLEEAGLDAWLLLEFKTGKNRAYYFAHGDEPVSDETAAEYLTLIDRRAGHIPVQQLTHQAFFMGYEFYVNENVLIPRQDTETLVEEALKHLGDVEKPEILDMCTGSGCILLSLLLERQDACGTGMWRTGRILWKAICSRHRIFVKKVEKIVGNMISLFQIRLISQQKKLKH